MKSLTAASTSFFLEIQLKKQNLKSVVWALEFGHPKQYTGLPNSLDMFLATGNEALF